MTAQATNRDKARDVFRLANYLGEDLIFGTRAHGLFCDLVEKSIHDKQKAAVMEVGFDRLCLFYVIMTLAKVCELYRTNTAILPPACRDDFKCLVKSIDERGILKFRNNVAGHLYDDTTKRPLTTVEVNSRVDAITQGNLQGFFLWVNNKKDNSYPTTVVSVVERVRDLLRDEHKFSADDLK